MGVLLFTRIYSHKKKLPNNQSREALTFIYGLGSRFRTLYHTHCCLCVFLRFLEFRLALHQIDGWIDR